MNKLICTIITLFLIGCSPKAINLKTGNNYFNKGVQSEKEGDWFHARMYYSRAWTNGTLGNAKDNEIASIAYEYGRSSGAICDWGEAERGLLESNKFYKNKNIPNLIELARMFHAQGKLNESLEYFTLANDSLNKTNIISQDPIGFADFLGEYSTVLNSSGKPNEAAQILKKEKDIRANHKNQTTNFVPTPHGKFCHQNPEYKAN